MDKKLLPTKVLFIDADEASFQIWQCMARTLEKLPPMELFYAQDATEGLNMLEDLHPDVIVVNLDEDASERDIFLDSLYTQHPPVIVPAAEITHAHKAALTQDIHYIKRHETLDGILHTLITAATAAQKTKSLQITLH